MSLCFVVMLSVIMLNVIMLSVIMLTVIMLNVIAPFWSPFEAILFAAQGAKVCRASVSNAIAGVNEPLETNNCFDTNKQPLACHTCF